MPFLNRTRFEELLVMFLASITYSRWAVVFLVCMQMAAGKISHAQNESTSRAHEKATFVPQIHHPNIERVTLFCQNPAIVTPVGIAVAPDGRVFVQENHTHQRESNYKGPKTDRILVFKDTDHDGVSDKRAVYHQGHSLSTDLLFGPDGHLYFSTRSAIGRFLDAARNEQAGESETLVVCETDGTYPHNGVGGLAIDSANPDRLAFGFGENLGADYTFVGSDGVKISGGAEGGSTYICQTDGSELEHQSTGHWNAFGMTYDLSGNLFTTDNDPNATPPNRLLHIVPGADFGYEYRYGRSGRHPLICWYGEHPGTLGMIGALGEAACGVVAFGPGQLLSASWTDNRIDLHRLEPKGATFIATREPFLSGPDDFRPVHMAHTHDGKSMYFTDWVKQSYPVHGYGRVWRVDFKKPVALSPLPRQNADKKSLSPAEALEWLGSEDPYQRTKAIECLGDHPKTLSQFDWKRKNATVRSHFAVALKRQDAAGQASIIPELLQDNDSRVRFVGIKWIADAKLTQYRDELEQLFERADLESIDLRAAIATLDEISRESGKEFFPDAKLLELARDRKRPAKLRAKALQVIDVDHRGLCVDVLANLAKDPSPSVRREAVRSLVLHQDAERFAILRELAALESLKVGLRSDAIAGLAAAAQENVDFLKGMIRNSEPLLAEEAERSLGASGLIVRELVDKPDTSDLVKWEAMLEVVEGETDVELGRRLFFHPKLGRCYKCHQMQGRGYSVGPDLTTINQRTGVSRKWLLEHIVDPNSEMAPYYRPQQLLTLDGQVFTGLVLGIEGQSQAYVDADGVVFYVDKENIEERRELKTSIMPAGLLDNMNAREIRDLIAFLLHRDATR